MTNSAEDTLFLSLTDTNNIEILAKIGLDAEAIPTEEMRPVVAWAIEQFFQSGRTVAPTRDALMATWGREIEDAKVELLPEDEDDNNVQWAIETLKANYINSEQQNFIRAAAAEMYKAPTPDKAAVLADQANRLFALSMRVQPRHMQIEASQGFRDAFASYEVREREGHVTRGMTFGLPPIDEHTFGIHEGELAVLAAAPKAGKSFFLARTAKESWKQGHDTVLFTLENSVEMTMDRIICMELAIDYRRWQRGLCSVEEKNKVAEFINDIMPIRPAKLHVVMPEPSKRTMLALVRQAQIMGSTKMFIDQLTFVEHPSPGRKPRQEVIRDLMHDLKTLISTGNEPISALVAHQINRTGVESARTKGVVQMEHMAEGAEVERTADWLFSLHRNEDNQVADEAIFQIVASRREELKAWKLFWRPAIGAVNVMNEHLFDA